MYLGGHHSGHGGPCHKAWCCHFLGISTVIHGGLSSLKDLATAMKPDSGICFCATLMVVWGVCHLSMIELFLQSQVVVFVLRDRAPWCHFPVHWVKIFGAPLVLAGDMAFTIEGMMGPLVHPLLLANEKEPQGWAPLFWLWLLSHMALGSSGF